MFTHKSRLLGSALGASAVAASMLVGGTLPASAATPHQIELLSLTCHDTEDTFGHDEAYLTVNGVKVWGDVDMIEGSRAELRTTVGFDQKAFVRLYDADTGLPGDRDDHLGTVIVKGNQVNHGTQEATFEEDGAKYTLTYRVVSG
jgi:hypothetical protein